MSDLQPDDDIPPVLGDHWYDRALYRLGLVRAHNYNQLWRAYSDVFDWWAKLVKKQLEEEEN